MCLKMKLEGGDLAHARTHKEEVGIATSFFS
jgi:hypothetical protein